jgi:hypothetical protein
VDDDKRRTEHRLGMPASQLKKGLCFRGRNRALSRTTHIRSTTPMPLKANAGEAAEHPVRAAATLGPIASHL